MGKRKRGRSARNSRKSQVNAEPEDIVKAPHSFVINCGKLGKTANELLLNFRRIMQPFTASKLRVLKSNTLKDFVHNAGPLNVSHIVMFTKSRGMTLRFLKLPHGPTLTFKIQEYSLMRDIISSQKKSIMYEKLFRQHPLLVLNNFSGEGMHFKLMASTFQNMFPSINVNKTQLNSIRRCLLFNYNSTDNTIDLRHYAIKVVPTGMSRAVKKLVQSKVPNLSNYQEIGDFLQTPGNLSESEYELDTPANIVTLPQPISTRGNIVSEKSAVRLYELGPRIKIQLIKIEEGLMDGAVLYHEFKTQEEIKAMTDKIKAEK
ncbi:suppressor of SWI4 1 homolog [Trichonephila clavata]|uniref:Suppressor of SWI4 1 homolog n=1 Tax=Trichonephila clavata TaxID=2740835 RepID=A0A8X6HJS6_TRICU|nr:suppressor of SWI4 1 homolog [Trichonephila clavata]